MSSKMFISLFFILYTFPMLAKMPKKLLTSLDVGQEVANAKLTFTFKVKIPNGYVFNGDGPWKLQLDSHEGLDFVKKKFRKEALNEKLPGFEITTDSQPTMEQGSLKYRLTAFICTADKRECYREVHKGEQTWRRKG